MHLEPFGLSWGTRGDRGEVGSLLWGRSGPRGAPTGAYAALGQYAPIAWPSGFANKVPVSGTLSPHAAAALKRMGITKD